MKKVVLIVLLAITSVFTTIQLVAANEGEVADVTVHVKKWSEEYDAANVGAHHWGGTHVLESVETDTFGYVYKFTNVDVTKELGFIPVYGIYKDGVFTPDWNKKITSDVKIQPGELVAGENNHVYVFQGVIQDGYTHPHFVAKNDQANLLLVYADPSGVYEDNLGVHAWGDWHELATGWGAPGKIFKNGATHGAIPEIKVAMLHTLDAGSGFLIYAGEDGNKKTGDVTIKDALGSAEAVVPGAVGFAYVYSKGNAYIANDNVTYGTPEEFVENAFSFKLLPMGTDKQGQYTGTYAPRANQVLVELSAEVASPLFKTEKYMEEETVKDEDGNEVTNEVEKERKVKVTTEAEVEAGKAKVKSWFTIKDNEGKTLEIESIDFAENDETIKSFVVILKENSKIDTSKTYEVTFDLGLTGEENKKDTLEINIDREAPSIQFINPSNFDTLPSGERIILVEWDKLFDRSLFPTFTAMDDRDGDITKVVYVVSGEGYNSVLDTNRLGDYTITLRVEDSWGNVTEEAFTFRVQQQVK